MKKYQLLLKNRIRLLQPEIQVGYNWNKYSEVRCKIPNTTKLAVNSI